MRTAGLLTVVLLAVVLLGGGCTSGRAAGPIPARGGTAVLANLAGTGADWILPLGSPELDTPASGADFIDLMYRPLYLFGGNSSTSVLVNYPLSLARPAVTSNGGRTVTINLKGWKWSDGETVDAADVVFWLNLNEAEELRSPGYPATLPADLGSYRVTGPDQVTLQLTRPVATTWFTSNQLADITPLPLAFDVTSLHGPPGSGGCVADTAADHWARCRAVLRFLTGQARRPSTYATSPLWRVVDGPWRLTTFSIAGGYTFAPNRRYSGSPKPVLAQLKFRNFNSLTAIYQALKSGQLSVVTVPAQDLPAKSARRVLPATDPLAAAGYRLQPAYSFAIYFAEENWNNPVYGPLFRQLYFRQALQELTDQTAIAQVDYGGYAYPTVAGIPSRPASKWLPATLRTGTGTGAARYDPGTAEAILAAHGWRIVGRTLTCEVPGTSTGSCGADIPKGRQASLSLSSYEPSSPLERTLASELAVAGIRLTQSFAGSLLSDSAVPCRRGPLCRWTFGPDSGWVYDGPGFEPTGEPIFLAGVPGNAGRYRDSRMDTLIRQTEASNSPAAFAAYASYTAAQLPVLFLPTPYSVVAVSTKLHGVTQSPVGTFLPEYWYYLRK